MTIGNKIIESIIERNHPKEFSKKDLQTVFSFDENVKELPPCIKLFKDTYIFGESQEKGVLLEVKKIYNQAIIDCIEKINEAYSFVPGCGGTAEYINNLLDKNMINLID